MRTPQGAGAPAPAPESHIDLAAPWTDPDRPAPPPSRSGAPPLSHLEWAENIARLIADDEPFWFGARSHEADDLVAVAWKCLARIAPRFDFSRVPAGGDANGQFRGWAHQHLTKECRRAAERMWRARAGELDERCPNCAVVMGWGTGGVLDDDGEDEERPEDVNAWLKAHGYE